MVTLGSGVMATSASVFFVAVVGDDVHPSNKNRLTNKKETT